MHSPEHLFLPSLPNFFPPGRHPPHLSLPSKRTWIPQKDADSRTAMRYCLVLCMQISQKPKQKHLPLLCSPVQNIQAKVDAARLQRPWSLAHRRQQLAEDQALRQHNQSAKEQGSPQRFFWRSLYLPEQGMFCQAPRDLQLGTRQKVTVAPAVKNTACSC